MIKNKTFLFDDSGRMLTGLRKIEGEVPALESGMTEDSAITKSRGVVPREGGKDLEEGIYYFSTESGSQEGAMQTGKQVVNDDGEEYTYYFSSTGKAYTDTLMKGAVYDHEGRRIEAEDGSKYELVYVEYDIKDGDKTAKDENGKPILDENGKPVPQIVIPSGTPIIVNSNGTVKKSASSVDVDGVKYTVTDYVASVKLDQD